MLVSACWAIMEGLLLRRLGSAAWAAYGYLGLCVLPQPAEILQAIFQTCEELMQSVTGHAVVGGLRV